MSVKKIELSIEDLEKLVNEHYNKFNSTMLDIISKRVKNIKPCNLIRNYDNRYSFYQPSSIDPRTYNSISNLFFDSVENDFECIELSPINPLGLNSVLTPVNQNNVLSTIRNSEVVSDSSVAMALECAHRIKHGLSNNINLASSSRLLRMQNYGNGKKSHWTQHFRACSLISSFRNNDDNIFKSLILQIENWIKVVENLKLKTDITSVDVNICYLPLIKEIYMAYGVDDEILLANSVNPEFDIFKNYNIELDEKISSISKIDDLKEKKDYLLSIKNNFEFLYIKIISYLKEQYPDVNFNLQLNRKSGLNYYSDICYEVLVSFNNNKELVLVDGGVTDWTGILLSDSKQKCVTSGMGLEYLSKVYKR